MLETTQNVNYSIGEMLTTEHANYFTRELPGFTQHDNYCTEGMLGTTQHAN